YWLHLRRCFDRYFQVLMKCAEPLQPVVLLHRDLWIIWNARTTQSQHPRRQVGLVSQPPTLSDLQPYPLYQLGKQNNWYYLEFGAENATGSGSCQCKIHRAGT